MSACLEAHKHTNTLLVVGSAGLVWGERTPQSHKDGPARAELDAVVRQTPRAAPCPAANPQCCGPVYTAGNPPLSLHMNACTCYMMPIINTDICANLEQGLNRRSAATIAMMTCYVACNPVKEHGPGP